MEYLAVSLCNITDAMMKSYNAEQKRDPVHDDGHFLIDDVPPKVNLPSSNGRCFSSNQLS